MTNVVLRQTCKMTNVTGGVEQSPALRGPVQSDHLLHDLVFFSTITKFIVHINLMKLLTKYYKLNKKQKIHDNKNCISYASFARFALQ